MRKDIESREVLDFGIALIPEDNKELGRLWDVYLVNLKETPIHHVLVNVLGRGELQGRAKNTAQIRYYFQEIAPLSYVQVEVMMPEVAALTNQYWVSFSHDNYLFDKKYLITPESIDDDPDLIIPVIGKLGVWYE